MGLASNQARLNILTVRRSDLEYRLTMLSQRAQNLALNQAVISQEKAVALQNYTMQLQATTEDQDNTQAYFQYKQSEADYEAQMNQLSFASNALDMEREAAETELKAINAEEEQVSKLVENNAKEGFKYFN